MRSNSYLLLTHYSRWRSIFDVRHWFSGVPVPSDDTQTTLAGLGELETDLLVLGLTMCLVADQIAML